MFTTKPSKFKIGTILSPYHEISVKIKSTFDQEHKHQNQGDAKDNYPVEDSDEEGEILSVHGRKYFGSLEVLKDMQDLSSKKAVVEENENQMAASSNFSAKRKPATETQEERKDPEPQVIPAFAKKRRCSQTREVIVQNSCARV